VARKGRKPLATGHVESLSGSPRAKQRLEAILGTVTGELTIAEACATLDVCQSRFHALRHEWLQDALELLEPRPMGRPPKASPPADGDQVAKLLVEKEELKRQLHVAEVRREIAAVLPHVISAPVEAPKKTASPMHGRQRSSNRRRRRPR